MTILDAKLSAYWNNINVSLFPYLREELGPLTAKQAQLIITLEVVRIEDFVPPTWARPGRPLSDRAAIARAFVAKAVYNISTTRDLCERLKVDRALRRTCGWQRLSDVPSESVFSRAFAEFATSRLPQRVQEALITAAYGDRLVGHVSRDATAIEARERPAKKPPQEDRPARPRGRPRKGEQSPCAPTRMQRQLMMSLPEMLKDLPSQCDVGTKKNSKGFKETWTGYKLHIDSGDGEIPLSCVLTSASLHDSQVALPLATMTAQRVVSLYDLMDSAYDAAIIKEHSLSLGHIPIIDTNCRGDTARKEEFEAEARRRELVHLPTPEQVRYNERSTAERVNSRIKDEFGGRHVRVRGHAKVLCHLMFGVIALVAGQLIRLTT